MMRTVAAVALLVLAAGPAAPGVALSLRPFSLVAQESDGATGQAPAAEEGPTRVHPEAREAIDRLKSPFCPGLMLEVCPSPQAAELRDSLDALARQGVASDSLVAMVLATHGEEWRAVPEARGGGLLAWLVPPAALLAGLLVLVVGLRRVTGSPEDGAGEGAAISDEEQTRLREAMEELEAEEEPLF